MVPELSVVIPMYNEEQVLPLLVQRLRPVLDGLGTSYEVVAVDDGSKDQTAVLLQRYRREWEQLRVVRLRANSGHQAAISAGLVSAHGDFVVTLDADLQDPPETIADMLRAAHEEGVDVVYGVRSDRSTDTFFKRETAKAFYSVHSRLTGMETAGNAGDFRLMSRATVDAVNALPEHGRVLRFVVPALNFPSASVSYKREERAAGESKYPFMKMVMLSVDSIIGFSLKPLRLATWFGFGGFIASLLLIAYAVVGRFTGHAIAGWASTVGMIALVGGLQLLCLGILGEYLGRMYQQLQERPNYFIAYDSARDRDDHRFAIPRSARMATGQPAGATAARPAVTLQAGSVEAGAGPRVADPTPRGTDTSEGTLDAHGLAGEPIDR
ncbi:glycosyltransferase family 2 protein [Arsenicicoccus bolidensis]|uniref:Glycosyltransferase family 2 protein n=1 Tax=Arsenicicoccus bolidensis TaxID=229480 RepID=A0ABS9PZP2_9MICO|nr:glycosyltransferase family 2 protein [Arsenicicoccus bolidensis]MCG7321098.1 glycosyltransferase family 2 protein [Arsenicicoccus bolidensis]